MRGLGALVSVLALGALVAATPRERADLVLRNGKLLTMDPARPVANAVAIAGDRIVAVGSDAEIDRFRAEGTRVIDLAGKTAMPGFIDGHAHFVGIGDARIALDLRGAASWDEVVARVASAAAKARPGEWILGRGWHQKEWAAPPSPNVEGFPLHATLSAVTPANPVLLSHASGHAAFANAVALERGGVGRDTKAPDGGEILRDSSGAPTGLLRETAEDLVSAALQKDLAQRTPAQVTADLDRRIDLAVEECLRKGITSIHDAGSSLDVVARYRQRAEAGTLGVRVYAMLSSSNEELEREAARVRVIGAGRNHLTVRAVKRLADGALGSRGAWLLAPYADAPGTGLCTYPTKELERTAEIAAANGFQLGTHAIGDRANREVLDVYARVLARHPKKDLRFRIEHAQHLDPADVPRFGKLGVLAMMQGIHCPSDAPFVPARLGATRSRDGAYAWRRLLDAGARIGNGTDAPVEDVNPIASFHASVTRQPKRGPAFFPEQRMTRMEALRSYTVTNAYAAFEEGIKGALAPGMLADLVVLSRDLSTIPDAEIPSTRVLATVVGGRVVFEASR
ncbi:MAG TPA: amidohydrolase [Thermoanaerobaculia bacterium]|nr:amidohydrolase [Thermoanaerobaculia bacterium]